MVTSHTCVRAAQSVMPCLSRAFLILCASTHRTPPRDCSGGRRQQPEPDSFDWHVSFASEWLGWVGWLAPWSRSSQASTCWLLERFTCADGPRSIDFELVWRPLIEWLNVETWPFPACGSWIHAPSA